MWINKKDYKDLNNQLTVARRAIEGLKKETRALESYETKITEVVRDIVKPPIHFPRTIRGQWDLIVESTKETRKAWDSYQAEFNEKQRLLREKEGLEKIIRTQDVYIKTLEGCINIQEKIDANE
jgi:hypothetical protein